MQQFDFITALIYKDKHIAVTGIPAKDILHKSAEPVDAFSHIGWLAVQMEPVFG